MPATQPPKTGGGVGWTKPVNCAPRNHRNARRSPKLDLKIESLPCPKVINAGPAESAAKYTRQRRARDTEFARYFRGKKPRESLPEIVRSNRRFLDFPYINPKPHNFRPLGGDDQVPHMQLGRLLTPDPLNLRLKLQALSGDHTHPYNPQVHTSQHRGKGKFITSRAKSPNYSPSKYFPKERYDPAFSAHDALLDRIMCTLTSVPKSTSNPQQKSTRKWPHPQRRALKA
eukprot:Em0001g3278a